MEYQEVTPGAPREGEPRDIGGVRRGMVASRIFLQPIADPWTVGLLSLGAVSFILGAHWAGWYGRTGTPTILFPFILLFGGLVQLLAGIWSFRSRDVVSTVTLLSWGTFWLGYGLLNWLVALGIFPPMGVLQEFGIVFFALTAITLSATISSLSENAMLFGTLAALTVGSLFLGLGQQLLHPGLMAVGGWLMLLTGVLAWYTATALMLESSFNRRLLPIFEFRQSAMEGAVDTGVGEPGVVRHHHPGAHRSEPGTSREEPGGVSPTPA